MVTFIGVTTVSYITAVSDAVAMATPFRTVSAVADMLLQIGVTG